MDFDTALGILLDPQHEGGYSRNQADPGGETWQGVSRRNHPTWAGWQIVDSYKTKPGFPQSLNADAALQQCVRGLYFRDYWGAAGCDALPDAIKFDVFDMAVNSGVTAAIRIVQRVAGVTQDGVLGPQTLMALNSIPVLRLTARINGARLAFMAQLPNWPAAGRGWATRIANNLLAA